MSAGDDRWTAAFAAAQEFNAPDILGNTPLKLFIRHPDKPRIGLILGSGWGDAIALEPLHDQPLEKIPGFEDLAQLTRIKGHPQRIQIASIADHDVIVLRGRIHLNEAPNNPDVARMARLQIEMLDCLGVNVLIATCAVGSLSNDFNDDSLAQPFHVGDIAAIDGLVTLFAPDMPLWGGEFCSPEDSLDSGLVQLAEEECGESLIVRRGAYAIVRDRNSRAANTTRISCTGWVRTLWA